MIGIGSGMSFSWVCTKGIPKPLKNSVVFVLFSVPIFFFSALKIVLQKKQV